MDKSKISAVYNLPLLKLVDQAFQTHKQNFDCGIELCQLVSVKTGGCPEDCAYCSQSNQHNSEIKLNPLLPVTEVAELAQKAKKAGVTRLCLGAAYRSPNQKAIAMACEYIKVVKDTGLETCITFGSLNQEQAMQLKEAGLDYYNHNIDTSPEYYPEIITTRTFDDRVNTIKYIGAAGIKICCGGIIGMGESKDDRISFITALTQLPYQPESIPVNTLVKIKGTKLYQTAPLDKFELIRTIATIRIVFPAARIRLSAGRRELSQLEQAFCFMSGANSIWYGEKLLTADNNDTNEDKMLLAKLGILTNEQ